MMYAPFAKFSDWRLGAFWMELSCFSEFRSNEDSHGLERIACSDWILMYMQSIPSYQLETSRTVYPW